MDFEDILLEVGDRGKYQKKLIFYFLLPASTLVPWFAANVLFMVSVPEHWCSVPEVISSNLTIKQQRMIISPPATEEKPKIPSCKMYNISYTEYLNSGIYEVPNDTQFIDCNNGWEYDKTYYDSTVATQWNMYCDDAHYASFVLTLYSIGSVIGTPVYGALSDRIGRRITFYIVLVFTAIFSFASVFMTNFTAFVFFKTVSASVMPAGFQIPYIIIIELVAPELRTHMNGLVNCSFTIGLSSLPLIAYLTRNYVKLGIVTSLLTLFFMIYWKFLPESPRWLLSQEKYEETLTIMKKIAETNGKSVDPDQLLSKLKVLGEKIKKEKTVDEVKNSAADLLRYPQLRKIFLVISLCWVADVMAYYGLILNVSNLGGNEFLNFFLTTIVEIPGNILCWILMGKYGRRWISAIALLLTSVACLSQAVVAGLPHADIICSVLGKFFASAAFMATYQQSAELFPTVIRSLGMGMSGTISIIASIFIPYLVYLAAYGKAIPFLVIGSICVIAAVSASFLPETLNENLPQTISDVEEFGRNLKYLSWKRRKASISRERRASSLAMSMKGVENNESKD